MMVYDDSSECRQGHVKTTYPEPISITGIYQHLWDAKSRRTAAAAGGADRDHGAHRLLRARQLRLHQVRS